MKTVFHFFSEKMVKSWIHINTQGTIRQVNLNKIF
jgi:hypothetical protein